MDFKNLGKQTSHQLSGADASLLERVANPCIRKVARQTIHSNVTIIGDEFTSVCPATGGPDFGEIKILYTPREWIVESKSLKYYLESYRNEPIFHEQAVAKICVDIGTLLSPLMLKVEGTFKARGGWSIIASSSWTLADG